MALTIPHLVEAVGPSWLGYWYFLTSEDAPAKIQSKIPLYIDLSFRSHNTVHPELYGVDTIKKIISGEIANPGPSDLMSEKERQFYIQTFEASGIDKPLNYYRQVPHGFAIQEELKPNPILPITLPTLLMALNYEPFAHPDIVEKSKEFVPSLEVVRIDSAHCVLMEKREEVTQIVGDWIEKKLKDTK
ncbi:Bifunctional epoxide hydrolase 2 [Tulasnella sp. JGI-2019a]|nr:Bifunctional epoxide hydrolase 2 [Tulasnella sp. JGI-2019a]